MKTFILSLGVFMASVAAAQTWHGAIVMSSTTETFSPTGVTIPEDCLWSVRGVQTGSAWVTVRGSNGGIVAASTVPANAVAVDFVSLAMSSAPYTVQSSTTGLVLWGSCR